MELFPALRHHRHLQPLRQRLIAAVEDGQSCRSAAKRFGVAASTAIKWMSRRRRECHADPKPIGGDRHSHRMEAHAEEILGLIDKTPDIALMEIVAHLEVTHGLRCRPQLGMALVGPPRHDIQNTAHAAEQQRPDVLRRREAWFDFPPDLDPERLVFIDETGASTKMVRLRGRAPAPHTDTGRPPPSSAPSGWAA